MTDLTITLTGELRESNFDEWQHALVERIRAVDVALSDDDEFASANDSIRELRAAKQTLKDARQAALEQAADIDRLFDAVTGETRQAPLTLERKIRVRRRVLKAESMQAHVDGNAATLDALPAGRQALFQDRSSLLALPFDELENTIDERAAVWRAALAESDALEAGDSAPLAGAATGVDARSTVSAPGGDPVVYTSLGTGGPAATDAASRDPEVPDSGSFADAGPT